jgi:uncharacterized protein (TIRG00374 family)
MPDKKKQNNLFSLIGRLALSALLLVFLFSKIDTKETFELLKTADMGILAVAFAVFFIVHIVMLSRWLLFIRALELKAHAWNVIRYFFIGLFGNLFLPSSIGGDVIKIFGLCQHSDQKPKVVASVLLDRLSGFVSITVIAVCSFMFGHALIGDNAILAIIAGMAAALTAILTILFNEPIYEFFFRFVNWLPKLKAKLMEMHYDISLLKGRPAQGLGALSLAFLGQIIFIICFYFIAKALRQDIPFIYFLVFIPLICVASSLPSIGGLGVREFGAAYLFSKVGVAEEVAVSMSLVSFFFMVVLGLIGGVVYVFTFPTGRVQHHLSAPGTLPGQS